MTHPNGAALAALPFPAETWRGRRVTEASHRDCHVSRQSRGVPAALQKPRAARTPADHPGRAACGSLRLQTPVTASSAVAPHRRPCTGSLEAESAAPHVVSAPASCSCAAELEPSLSLNPPPGPAPGLCGDQWGGNEGTGEQTRREHPGVSERTPGGCVRVAL